MFNLTEYVSQQAAVYSNNSMFSARSVIIFLVNILDAEYL